MSFMPASRITHRATTTAATVNFSHFIGAPWIARTKLLPVLIHTRRKPSRTPVLDSSKLGVIAVRQAGRLLARVHVPHVVPGRPVHLPGGWAAKLDPAGGPVDVTLR